MRHPDIVLRLKAADKRRLKGLKQGEMTARKWLRMQILELLGRGRHVQAVADGLGTYPRVVRRVSILTSIDPPRLEFLTSIDPTGAGVSQEH